MKKFLLLSLFLFCGYGFLSAQGIEDIKIKAPKADESIRKGKTYTISWDTLDSKGNRTFETTFEFFWAESETPAKWNMLQVGKASGSLVNTFKDVDSKAKTKATGKVVSVFPTKDPLYIKMQVKDNPTVSKVVGPIHIVVPPAVTADSTITGDINNNITLSNNKLYQLKGVVYVQDGGVIRINPGTVIFGDDQATSALVINRGGKIYAKGTRTQPIVFTSPFAPGNRDRGDWGGVLVMGNASTNLGESAIEGGISDAVKKNGWYGKWNGVNNDDDSSGVIEYVRIEFAGIAESPDNELNGLTMGGVGRKTVINHVQVSYGGDDSFEWFGGTVNAKNLIAFNGIDDDFDTDNGFNGKIQFGISYRFPNIADQSNSEAFESDNDANASENEPFTSPIFTNMTVIGGVRDIENVSGTDYNAKYLAAAQIRRNSRMSLYNSLIIGWPAGLEMTNNNTVKAFEENLAQVQFNDFIGIKGDKFFYFGSSTSATENVTKDWLSTPSFGNKFNNKSGNIANYAQISNLYPPFENMTNLNLLPVENADFKNTASFAPEKLQDPFFEVVSYRGAFSTDITLRWDADWANYDPVNTLYKTGDVIENETEINTNLINVSIYPNPVSTSSFVQYVTPIDGNVTIKLYNELGSVVKVIAEDIYQISGTYQFHLNSNELSTGVYFLNITSGNNTVIKNINVIK